MIFNFSATLIAILFLAFSSFAETRKVAQTTDKRPHDGFCIINEQVPTVKDKTQFLCFVTDDIIKFRCGLAGEGSKIRVGTYAKYGKNEGFEFVAKENWGNHGFIVCEKE